MVWFKFKEVECSVEVLKLLSSGKTTYSEMFRTTKVSHTTLQNVLSNRANAKAITKKDIGHKKVDYEITDKGKKLLKLMDDAIKLSR